MPYSAEVEIDRIDNTRDDLTSQEGVSRILHIRFPQLRGQTEAGGCLAF